MKCPNCGADSSGKFCEYCGSELPYNGPQSVQNSYKTENVTHVTNVYYVNSKELPSWDQPLQNQEPVPVPSSQHLPNKPYSAAQNQIHYSEASFSPKNKSTALLLCFFLGFYGGHLFYVGRWKKGLIYLCTGGLFLIGWLIDLFTIGANNFTDADGKKLTGKAKTAWIIIIVVVIFMLIASLISKSQY